MDQQTPPPRHPHADQPPLLPPLELPELPESYPRARLLLLPQTPTSLMATWSFDPAVLRSLGGRAPSLRLVHAASGAVVRAVAPEEGTWRWFFDGLTAGDAYRAELGHGDATFVALLTSDDLALPPDHPAASAPPPRRQADPDAPLAGFLPAEPAPAPARTAPVPAEPLPAQPSSHTLVER